MKKTIPAGIALIAALAAAAPAAASDTNVSLGVKAWANTWKETVKPAGGDQRTFDNGGPVMAGPSLNVRFSTHWFAEAAYLAALGDYESPDWFATGDKMKFERKDLDAMAGYFLQDPLNDLSIGLFVAYKAIDAPASYTNPAAVPPLNDAAAGTWKLTGPGVGVLVEKPLDDSTVLNGKLAYLFLQEEFAFSSGGVSRFDTGGWALEVSAAHTFTKAISAYLGVRFERFKGEKDNGDHVTDSFSGLTAGIAYQL